MDEHLLLEKIQSLKDDLYRVERSLMPRPAQAQEIRKMINELEKQLVFLRKDIEET